MRVALSWLRDYVDLPASADGRAVAERLLRAGLEVETVERVGDVSGPLVVGEVLDFVEEPQKNGKTIRWCQVRVRPEGAGTELDDTEPEVRGIVCGAHNFAVGDHVVARCPAPCCGPFPITARSHGVVRRNVRRWPSSIGDDNTGILVLEPTTRSALTPSSTRLGERCSTSPSPPTAATACRCAGGSGGRHRLRRQAA